MAKERFRETADYTVSAGPDGYCFRFYCAVSGALPCVAGPIRKGSQDTTLETAWQTVGGAISTSAIDAGDGFPMSCIMWVHWNAWNAPPGSSPCISARNAGRGFLRQMRRPFTGSERTQGVLSKDPQDRHGTVWIWAGRYEKKEGLPGLRRRYGGSLQFLPPVQQAAAEPVIPTKKARTGGFL